jgi:hypothetical protein
VRVPFPRLLRDADLTEPWERKHDPWIYCHRAAGASYASRAGPVGLLRDAKDWALKEKVIIKFWERLAFEIRAISWGGSFGIVLVGRPAKIRVSRGGNGKGRHVTQLYFDASEYAKNAVHRPFRIKVGYWKF